MAASPRDEEFDEYDKPGAERSRRRRGGGDDDDLDSDLEGDLLEEDWLSSKKNPSELSDEELNDDLLQSDEEDQGASLQDASMSLNATSELQVGNEYADDEYGATQGVEGYRAEGYADAEGTRYDAGGDEDEVLELQIDEPLDDEFRVQDYGAEPDRVQPGRQEVTEGEELEEEVEKVSQVTETDEIEPETKEESDEDEEDDEESERLRFKTERKDSTVVRLSDATSKRRNIPETLELTEEAKADLLEFEEKERQRKQGRFGGRGRGAPGGGRGGPYMFGMGGFRKDGGRGRMNEPRPPLMAVNLGMQPRILSPHSHRVQPPRPSIPSRGGPGLFPPPLIPIPQQPLQSLIPPRSPAPHQRPQPEPHPQRPQGHAPPHAHSNQQQQPKNIHINPHFRGPSPSSPAQVPMISPAPNQPRPNLGPQRFPGPADFQQHLQNNFLQTQRPPPQEQWRGPPPPHQERELFFNNEPRFPAQPLFDLPGPAPLLNNNNLLPLSFPQPGPGFCPPGGGMFQRDLPPPPRTNLPPPQPSPAPPAPRSFMGHRQPFPPQQHSAPFSPQHVPFGMQNLMQPHPQPQHHDPPPPPPHHHPMQQQQHRQEVPPLLHRQHQPAEQHPIMHLSHPPFRQPILGGPRQMKPRPQNNMGRLRMGSPLSMQQIQNIPQRNSNLRELPIAPGNNHHHPIRPLQPRPLTKVPQYTRPGQGPGGGAFGQGRGLIKTPPPAASVTKNEMPALQMGTHAQKTPTHTPPAQDEDEETRQYRLKIEEQKRMREEILRKKEMRRQMQAGARKKELMERLGGQAPPQTPPAQPQTTPTPPQITTTTTTPTPPAATPNGVKSRLQNPGAEPKQQAQPAQRLVPQLQKPEVAAARPEEKNATAIQVQANAARKRTVMQRVNPGVPGSPQIPQKVRVVKRLTGGDEAPPLRNQSQQQAAVRAAPQQRLRKVNVASVGPQQSSQQQPPPPPTPLTPPQLQQTPDVNQGNRVVVSGRGRGARGGRLAAQTRQSARVAESQLCTVSIDGLSSSTNEKQIKNLLNSIGPIQMFKMMPQQRKAVATFLNPQHALSFQHSFHRHMIDLSHIDVTLIDG